jgi:hypothetical protein
MCARQAGQVAMPVQVSAPGLVVPESERVSVSVSVE